jgi:hypothetical protein
MKGSYSTSTRAGGGRDGAEHARVVAGRVNALMLRLYSTLYRVWVRFCRVLAALLAALTWSSRAWLSVVKLLALGRAKGRSARDGERASDAALM